MYNIFTFLVFRMGRNSALIGARRTTNGQQWLDINLRFVLCYVMLCCVVLCCVVLLLCCDVVVLCCAVLCYVMLCYVMLCYVMLCYVVLCCVVLCCVVRFVSLGCSQEFPFGLVLPLAGFPDIRCAGTALHFLNMSLQPCSFIN